MLLQPARLIGSLLQLNLPDKQHHWSVVDNIVYFLDCGNWSSLTFEPIRVLFYDSDNVRKR